MQIMKQAAMAVISLGLAGLSSAGSPYLGHIESLPGTVQAENFDVDGYYDTSSVNIGGQYRNEQVDIENNQQGGYNVGWFEPGEWLAYTVHITQAGEYLLDAYGITGGWRN
jgi:hypothetical protein